MHRAAPFVHLGGLAGHGAVQRILLVAEDGVVQTGLIERRGQRRERQVIEHDDDAVLVGEDPAERLGERRGGVRCGDIAAVVSGLPCQVGADDDGDVGENFKAGTGPTKCGSEIRHENIMETAACAGCCAAGAGGE